jgi:hypothetical protein
MRYGIFLLLLLFGGCASVEYDDYAVYAVDDQVTLLPSDVIVMRMDENAPVDIRGVRDSQTTPDDVYSPVYDGSAGAAGIAGQILIHAMTAAEMQETRIRQQRELADSILEPVKDSLQGFTQGQLQFETIEYAFFTDPPALADIVVDSKPIYYVSRDGRSMSVKNVINAYKYGREEPIYRNVVEVVAPLIPDADPFNLLGLNGGSSMKATTRKLYVDSLGLAVSDMRGELREAPDAVQRSHRIPHGGQLRVERGIKLNIDDKTALDADAVVLRNLRGWIISYHPDTEHPEYAPSSY